MYNKDVRESTSSLVDGSGAVSAAYEYDDFGNTTVKAGETFDNETCYTGQIYDQSTGLYYYNARFYNPENGRFVTQDTYRGESDEPDTLHLYAYCSNNPVNYVDPTGHVFVRTYTRYQCQTMYYLLRGIEYTTTAIGWVLNGRSLAKIGLKKLKKIKILKKLLREYVRDSAISTILDPLLKKPKWLYEKFKRGFTQGAWGFNKVRGAFRFGKRKVKYEKFEKIGKTKLLVSSPWNFRFYHFSKSKTTVQY